ncbi:MAG TPA: MFS transporter [Dyella sp.]|uniref:MFS transporter n=1 Tax=Dyella sp. TaxID=1869338 RepID=UPI002F93CF3B
MQSPLPMAAALPAWLKPARRATRLIFLLSGIAMSAWAPMVPYAKSRLGLDDAQLGLILLAFGGGSILSMPLTGWLVHHVGMRKVIVGAGVALCTVPPLLAWAPTANVLIFGLLYFGMALGAINVAMNAHAVEVERSDGRALMSGFHGLFSLGGLTGAAAVSALLATGLPLLACSAAVSTVLAAIVVSQRDKLLDHVHDEAAERPPLRLPGTMAVLLGLLCFASFMAEGSMLDWSALFLRDFRDVAASAAGIGYACFSIAMASGRLIGDRMIQRLGPVRMVRFGAALAAAGFAVVAVVPWATASLIGFVLIGLGASNIVPVMFSAAGRLPGASPAMSLAAVTVLGYAGLLIGPALIGFISNASSLAWAMVFLAGLLVVVMASARIVRR